MASLDGIHGLAHVDGLRLLTAATNGTIVRPLDDISAWCRGGIILTGENRTNRRKTCPSVTMSTRNPTWAEQGADPGPGKTGK
jgi:hypothetical protein